MPIWWRKAMWTWQVGAITNAVSEEYAALAAMHHGVKLRQGRRSAIRRRLRGPYRHRGADQPGCAKPCTRQGVHPRSRASLVSQGIVGFDDTAIPTYLAEEIHHFALTGDDAGAKALASSRTDPKMLSVFEEQVKRAAQIARAPQDAGGSGGDPCIPRWWPVGWRGGLFTTSMTPLRMPYILLAANRLARLFEQPADPGAETLATRQLAQIVQLDSAGERVRAEYF